MDNVNDDTKYIEKELTTGDWHVIMQPYYLCREKRVTCEYAAVNGWCKATTCINKGMPEVT